MNQRTESILSEVLTLPAAERAAVAEQILKSLEQTFQDDQEAEIAWQTEIDKRYSDITTGKVACISWEEVRSRLTERANDAR
ncbi:MAG TPA: addiction module protein [Bacteroidota bacterium]|nr:addiction module protein [Bacteroidota bacterium]